MSANTMSGFLWRKTGGAGGEMVRWQRFPLDPPQVIA